MPRHDAQTECYEMKQKTGFGIMEIIYLCKSQLKQKPHTYNNIPEQFYYLPMCILVFKYTVGHY